MRIPKSGKFLLVESGILGFGIRNSAQGIRNPSNDSNPESSTWNPESTAWNPELSWISAHGPTCLGCFSSHIYTKNNKYNYYTSYSLSVF